METCTRSAKLQILQNNLDFSLYAMPFIYHKVTTSEKQTEFKKVSSNKKCTTVKHWDLVFNCCY